MDLIPLQEYEMLQSDLHCILNFCKPRILFGKKSNFYAIYFQDHPFIFQAWFKVLQCLSFDGHRYCYKIEPVQVLPVLEQFIRKELSFKTHQFRPTLVLVTKHFYINLPHSHYQKQSCLIKFGETEYGLVPYLDLIDVYINIE
jgi:hypothetical protein